MLLGIDFGTTFTAAAIADKESVRLVELDYDRTIAPTAVFVQNDGGLVFGQDAWLAGMAAPERLLLDVKADLGRLETYRVGVHDVSVVDAAAAAFRHVRDMVVARVEGFDSATPVTITIPVSEGDGAGRMKAYRAAAERAGFTLDQLGFVAEPVAAATGMLADGKRPDGIEPGSAFLIYDLGGGTFDAAAMVFEGRSCRLACAPIGDNSIGGVRFDRAILDSILNDHSDADAARFERPDAQDEIAAWRGRMSLALRACREAKERLAISTQIPVAVPGLPPVLLSTGAMEAILEQFIERTIGLLKQLEARVSEQGMTPSGILLVGGSCRLRMVPRLLSERFALPLLPAPDPARVVAIGGAVHAKARMHQGDVPLPARRLKGERRNPFAAFVTPQLMPTEKRERS